MPIMSDRNHVYPNIPEEKNWRSAVVALRRLGSSGNADVTNTVSLAWVFGCWFLVGLFFQKNSQKDDAVTFNQNR